MDSMAKPVSCQMDSFRLYPFWKSMEGDPNDTHLQLTLETFMG